MAEKEIRFKLTGDSSNLNKSLDDAQKKASEVEKASQKSVSSLSAAASALVTAFAGAKIFNFFRDAVAAANQLDASMMKVASSARAMGQSTDAATKAAQDLAKDGFMSASQAAQALSNLMQTGLSVDQAKKFVAASKDITAFGNTIGDAAQATTDLTAGLLKGSALVIDNASPALKSLSSQYQKLLDTQGKSAAAQYAYNAILKESKKFSGDAAKSMQGAAGAQKQYDLATTKFSETLGHKLQPAFEAIYNVLAKVIGGIADFIGGLQSSTVIAATIVIAIVGGLKLISTSLVALGPILQMIGIKATATWAAMLGPIGLVIAAIGAVVVAFTQMFAASAARVQRQKEMDEYVQLANKIKLTADEKARLAELDQKFTGGNFLKVLKDQNIAIDRQRALLEATRREKAGQENKFIDVYSRITDKKQLERLAKQSEREIDSVLKQYRLSDAQVVDFLSKNNDWADNQPAFVKKQFEDVRNAYDKAAAITQQQATLGQVTPSSGGGGKPAAEFRFIAARDELRELTKEYNNYIKKVGKDSALGKEATERFAIEQKKKLDELRGAYAEYIEDTYDAERAKNEQEKLDAIANIRELQNFETEQILKSGKSAKEKEAEILAIREEAAKKIHKIEVANQQKLVALAFASMQATLTGAASFANGLNQVKNGDIGGGLSGAGQGFGAFGQGLNQMGIIGGNTAKALGNVGMGLGVVGAVFSLGTSLVSLFGKSDAERQREADMQRQRDEEARAILELQANYLKSILSLQEAQAKVPFTQLQQNLRLTDIQAQKRKLAGEDEASVKTWRLNTRAELLQGTLMSEGGKIAGGKLFGDVGSSPEELISFLNSQTQFAAFYDVVRSIVQGVSSTQSMFASGARSWFVTSRNTLRSAASKSGVPQDNPIFTAVDSFLGQAIAGIDNSQARYNLTGQAYEIFGKTIRVFGDPWGAEDKKYKNLSSKDKAKLDSIARQLTGRGITGDRATDMSIINTIARTEGWRLYGMSDGKAAGTNWYGSSDYLSEMLSESTADTSIAENLLSVIEQSQQTQLEISANTKKTAENTSLQLEKDRGDAFIDVARGGLAQGARFGSFLSPAPLSLSNAAAGLTLSSSIVKSIDERNLDQLIMLLQVSKDMRALLAEIAINTSGAGGDSTGFTSSELLALMSDFKSRS